MVKKMRINKKYQGIMEWCIAIVLGVICTKYSILSYGSFSPVKAHESSERTYHYGPSEIVKTIDLDKSKIYLCRYKDWFSANTVKKGFIKWYPGDQVAGTPIDYSKQVSYSGSGSSISGNEMIMKVYGYVNDPEITTMTFKFNNKEDTLIYDLDESRMFIFYWKEGSEKFNIKYLKGLDGEGNVILEERVMGL